MQAVEGGIDPQCRIEMGTERGRRGGFLERGARRPLGRGQPGIDVAHGRSRRRPVAVGDGPDEGARQEQVGAGEGAIVAARRRADRGFELGALRLRMSGQAQQPARFGPQGAAGDPERPEAPIPIERGYLLADVDRRGDHCRRGRRRCLRKRAEARNQSEPAGKGEGSAKARQILHFAVPKLQIRDVARSVHSARPPVPRPHNRRRFSSPLHAIKGMAMTATWTIISGGQTGVDRAALDVARELGLPYGGFIPKGRRTEDGTLPDEYVGMTETESSIFAVRTRENVVFADMTLILARGSPDGGTLLTQLTAQAREKPLLVLDLLEVDPDEAARRILAWLSGPAAGTLNVAGPRESRQPGIYREARVLLETVLGSL